MRSTQKLSALAERRGWSSLTVVPDDIAFFTLFEPERVNGVHRSAEDLLRHFRTRTTPQFFRSFLNTEHTSAEWKRRWPASASEIVNHASRIVDGQFELPGWQGASFSWPIDWHLEPLSNKQSPLIHWSKLDYLNAELAGDKKILWELNRHQYFLTLGQAYLVTKDERYAETFVAHLESWMNQNPPKQGINWASSLEIAFRSISWLWALFFFRDSVALTSQVFLRTLKFLYLNARHLETYLSTYFSPNTHLTGEALGLFYIGLLLPEFSDAARWCQTGRRILLEQLPIHVRPDGVYFEQSSYYHRYTTDFYTHFLILSQINGESVSPEVPQKLSSLLDHLLYITRPDGLTPFFGDDDGGRLVMLDNKAANDFRASLSTGAALFKRPDYKFVAGEIADETLWLLGPEAVDELQRIQPVEPASKSIGFQNSGYYVMRDGWTDKANYLLFDCGPHGQANCGHAHADALSFELAANGKTMLVDPGTYTYTGSAELRDWFRSSQAHNTLTVDGHSSSVPAGPFSWQTIATVKPLAWLAKQRFDYVAGSHDGYFQLPQPVTHRREMLFLKRDYWIMRDWVESAAQHKIDLWFHFESGADPVVERDGEEIYVVDSEAETGLTIHGFAENGRWNREERWVSHCYSQREPAPVYVFSTSLSSGNLVSFLVPRIAERNPRIREIEAVGCQAFEVVDENWLDIVMIRREAEARLRRLTSNFEWSWLRFSPRDDLLPVELVLLGGSTFSLEGRQIIETQRKVDYVVARRTGDEFSVEIDGVELTSQSEICTIS